ncbi:MAG: type II secretion system minor pseudopilin GspK [Gammaproteobacteria bacterium]|nr:type II secretion system minor pseudopilin GspK [Gammaproteobacteria bacterium]
MSGLSSDLGGRQRGVALITALLITALVTVVAVAMISRQQLDIRRTGNMLEADQAYMYALAAENFAIDTLRRDPSNVDTLLEDWARPLPPMPVEGGMVSGQIEDLQGRFNLNNLLGSNRRADPTQVRALQTLLQQVNRVTDDLNLPPAMANRVVDWIDPDINTSVDGAEDLEYLNINADRQIPYRTANQLMVSPSELALLLNMPSNGVGALRGRKLVSTLPAITTLNVNTAPPMVLMTLDQNITLQIASDLVQFRANQPFEQVSDFTDKLDTDYQIQMTTQAANRVSVRSEYFLVTATAAIGRTRLRMYSLLARIGGNITIIRRSFGTF